MLLGFGSLILSCLFSLAFVFFVVAACEKFVFFHTFRFYRIANNDAKSVLVLDTRAWYALHDFVHVTLIFSVSGK